MPFDSHFDTACGPLFEDTSIVYLTSERETNDTDREQAAGSRTLHEDGPVVAFVKAQLRKRAELIGWSLTQRLDLYLSVDGKRVDPIIRGTTARFHVPTGARDLWLISPTARPCETQGGLDDRDLGLYLSALRIEDGFSVPRDITVDDPLFCVGFYPVENGCRWTSGRALLPTPLWDGYEHGFFLGVQLAGDQVPRWVEPAQMSPEKPGDGSCRASAIEASGPFPEKSGRFSQKV